ncbi:hypothetical protein PYCCODRAFT_1439438 [Trametes coccinea BRFM310]|uniref:Zn(2)-C6 fungal-type domain-containing protein n=1 Tax=Trametes coccinea (strain BRFM310) TaxID=1353009 RepID=A0A1Y2IAY5_TRAC3|nr:hypothetical protein PYCCODRAFT_1439438 [Trametes coccinea BRFM310]
MALKGLPSPASGDSNSPSPDLHSDGPSTNASPLSASQSLYISQASDEGESNGHHSARGTPTRLMSDPTRANNAGKGGCWTCRVRRKKCDEEREGNSCKTCLRLHIECLGWGPKRPDWMRDKEKVAAYKADIKEKLSRMGLIRGQPRQPWHLSASQPSTPGVAGPGPQTSLRRSASARDSYHRREGGYMRGAPYHLPGLPGPVSGAGDHPHNILSSSSSRSSHQSPMLSLLPTPASAPMSDTHPIYGYQAPNGSSVALSGDDARYGFLAAPAIPMSVPTTPSIRMEEYIAYYFKHVRELQFVFFGEALANILYPLAQDHTGPVALSLCALAALHHARAKMARSPEIPAEDPDSEHAPSRQFYDRALYRLLQAPQSNGTGQYSDSDAVAAIQLVSYSVLGGGTMDWTTPLDFACEWLAQTGIYNEENPKLTLLGMSPAGRFAAKATMYIDVLSSITLKQPPRFLSLYKRLFGGGAGFWANTASPRTGGQHAELRMDALTGCPDEALLAIAEISALAHWKASELQSGSLSVRELIRRGDMIEKELHERTRRVRPCSPDENDNGFQTGLGGGAGGLDMGVAPAGLPMAMGLSQGQPGMAGASRSPRIPVDNTRETIADMFRETAMLYLHTVLSDSSPGVPEIISSVEQMMRLLNELTPSVYDRAVLLPLFLAGAMTSNQMMREVVKHRFFMQDATMGNVLLAQTVMESVWMQREVVMRATRPGGRPGPATFGDWRDHLRMEWASLLLM